MNLYLEGTEVVKGSGRDRGDIVSMEHEHFQLPQVCKIRRPNRANAVIALQYANIVVKKC